MRIFYHIPSILVHGPNAYANALATQLLFDKFYCILFYLKSLLFDNVQVLENFEKTYSLSQVRVVETPFLCLLYFRLGLEELSADLISLGLDEVGPELNDSLNEDHI